MLPLQTDAQAAHTGTCHSLSLSKAYHTIIRLLEHLVGAASGSGPTPTLAAFWSAQQTVQQGAKRCQHCWQASPLQHEQRLGPHTRLPPQPALPATAVAQLEVQAAGSALADNPGQPRRSNSRGGRRRALRRSASCRPVNRGGGHGAAQV